MDYQSQEICHHEFFEELNIHRKESKHLDLVLNVGGKQFPAHKLVLACICPYFEAMFNGCFQDSSKEEIELLGLEPETFELMLEYIYTGHVVFTKDTAIDIFKTADFLQLSWLPEECVKFMAHNIEHDNCISYWKLGESFQECSKLKMQALEYASTFLGEIMVTKDFLELEFVDLETLIASSERYFTQKNELYETIYTAIMKWIQHSPSKRKIHLKKLLAFVKTQDIRQSFLDNVIMKDNLLQQDIAAANWLLDNFSLTKSQNSFSFNDSATESGKKAPHLFIMDTSTRCSGFNVETKRMFWLPNRPMSQGFCALWRNEHIYIFGGLKTQNALRYDKETNHWEYIPFRTQILNSAGSFVDDTAYISGGFFYNNWHDTVLRYDLHRGRFDRGPRMIMKRAYHGSVVDNRCLYVCGGSNGSGESVIKLALSERMDIREGFWRLLPGMKYAHGKCNVAMVDETLYCTDIAGGRTECFDIRRGAWESIAEAPGNNGAIVSYNRNLYRIYENGISVYSPSADAWSRVKDYFYITPVAVAIDN